MIIVDLYPYSKLQSKLFEVTDIDDESITRLATGYIDYPKNYFSDIPRNSLKLKEITFDEEVSEYFPIVSGPATEAVTTAPDTIYIHPSWIRSLIIDGTKYTISKQQEWTSKKYIKLEDNLFFDITTMDTVSDLQVCTECGAVLHTEEEQELHTCTSCIDSKVQLNSYSYKPTPNFVGEAEGHYGIELEYGFNSKVEAYKLTSKHNDELYLKSDSSIRGGSFCAEVVSHPHSYASLMADNSFISTISNVKVEENSNNGCHIHMSRSHFKNNKHYGLFYFLFHSSKAFIEYVGGRELNNYCKFNPVGKIFDKSKDQRTGDRSVAINESNEHTIEIRIFNSTTSTNRVKSYVQFLEALVRFTGKAKNTVTLRQFYKYIKTNSSNFPELAEHLADYKGELKTTRVTFKEPTYKTISFSKLTPVRFNSIHEITTTDGTTHEFDHTRYYLRFDQHQMVFNSRSNGETCINYEQIASCRVVQ